MENNEQKNPIKQPAKPVTPKKAPKGIPKTVPKGIPTNVGQNAGVKNSASKPTVSNAELNKPKVKEIDSKNVAHKEDNTENKKKNKKLLLLLLLLLLIAGGVGTAIYFITKIPKTEIQFSIITKVKVDTTYIDSVGETQEKLDYVPGDDIDAKLTIKVENDKGFVTNTESVYLRFRIDIIVDGNNYYGGLFDPDFEYSDEWQYSSSDNYFYYKYVCYGNEEFTPFEKLNFVAERNNNSLNGKSGQLIFTVEILEGNTNAIKAMWQTAPSSWKPVTRN